MEFLEGVQEARYHVEQMMKELDVDALEDAAAVKMDPAGHQDNEDCDQEELEEHDQHQHCNPDNIDVHDKEKCTSLLRSIELPSNDVLKEKTRTLDEYQKEVVNIAVKYAKDIVKGRKLHNPHPRGPFVMVSGGAGAAIPRVTVKRFLLSRSDISPYQHNINYVTCVTLHLKYCKLSFQRFLNCFNFFQDNSLNPVN